MFNLIKLFLFLQLAIYSFAQNDTTTSTSTTLNVENNTSILDSSTDLGNQQVVEINQQLDVNGQQQCPSGWSTRADSNGKVYGYKVIMQDMINYYQASNLCRKEGASMVSVHSNEEAQFVAKLVAPLLSKCQNDDTVCRQRVSVKSLDQMLRSIYLGMNRAAIYPEYDATVVQTWEDGTTVDYASVPTPGVPQTIVQPWGPGSPTGANQTNQQGIPEDCVCIYDAHDDGTSSWNDISCYHKLGGVVCKLPCQGTTQPNQNPTCGSDGWDWAKEGNGNVGREYKVIDVPSPGNYWQALATCASNGAKVASYHNDEQKNLITKLCQSSTCAWIGHHTASDGNKYWDDGSQNNYQNYLEQSLCQKKPKSCGNANPPSGSCPNDCTAVSSSGQTTDQSCENSCGAVICEKECVVSS